MSDPGGVKEAAKRLSYWMATPTGGGMENQYCSSIVRTLNHLHENGYGTPRYATGVASEIQNLHTMLESMMAFTEEQAGIFWLGADHSWTPEDYVRILEAAAARPHAIIGAMYPISDGSRLAGEAAPDADLTKDLIRANYVGWGFTWTPFSAFRRIRPPFWQWPMIPDPKTGHLAIISPDVYFSRKAAQAGVEVLIHRRVVDVGHGQRLNHLTAREMMKRGKA